MPRHTGTPALHHDNKRKLSEPHARLHKQEPIKLSLQGSARRPSPLLAQALGAPHGGGVGALFGG